MKYIDNDIQKGIEYDYGKIRKSLKKKKVFVPDAYNPCDCPIEKSAWFIQLSERGIGKTTGWILFGMEMYMQYGTIIQYVRQSENMIMPKNTSDLFSVIIEHDYVSKITNGQYNNIKYKSRRWYFTKTDDDGNIIDEAKDHFMIALCLEKAQELKSAYNAPRGDLVIFDEFISRIYRPNEFIIFCDLLKTIARDRECVKIVCLANTIDRHNQYFHELAIHKEVQKMDAVSGEEKIITSPLGTKICVTLLVNVNRSVKKKRTNILYFGFDNPALASITGGSWAVNNYQHCIPGIKNEITVLAQNIYLEHNDALLNIELCSHPQCELFCNIHRATNTHDDSIIYTLADTFDIRYRFKFGTTKLDALIWSLYRDNKFFYATNEVGEIVADYMRQAKYR